MLFIVYGVSSQNNAFVAPDTSYTIWSATQKIKKGFPHAVPVRAFTSPNIYSQQNMVYFSSGKRELHADVFYRAESDVKKQPGVLLIHGGGWASGNKTLLVPLAQKLAENGFVAATVEYRISPEAK